MRAREVTIPRGSREEVRASEAPNGGLDLRVWFKAADGRMRPGREGLSLSAGERAKLTEMLGSAAYVTPRATMIPGNRG